MPNLADADTWRTVFTLFMALRRPDDDAAHPLARFLPSERAADWRAFSIECGLWRDAIDALQRAEGLRPDADDAGWVRDALWALADRVGASLGLAVEDLAGLDPAEPAVIRERLLRWVDARCAFSGLEPSPRGGMLGTEARTLLSIYDALMDAEPPRPCRAARCRGLIPPGSYAHRRYCDDCLRRKARDRTARRRAFQRMAGGPDYRGPGAGHP